MLAGGMIGSILEGSDEGRQLREIPSGKIHHIVKSKENTGSSIILEAHAVTPDCETLVVIDGKVRKHSKGKETHYDLSAAHTAILSPDGNLVGAMAYRPPTDGWFFHMLRELRIANRESCFVFYDLTTSQEVARLPDVSNPCFAKDGKTIVSLMPNSVDLYDWPPASPWGWILAIASGNAAVVFAIGQWLRWWQRRKPVTAVREEPKQ